MCCRAAHPPQSLGEPGALRPEIEAHEAGRAELDPGGQRHAVVQEVPVRIFEAERTAIDPGQVGGLDVRHRQAQRGLD
jgi:hypothetical protein